MIHPAATKSSPLPKPMEECDASGIHLEENRTAGMNDLKDELASLRIDRAERKRGRWGVWIFLLLFVMAVSAAGLYLVKTKPELTNFAATRSGSGTGQRADRRRRQRGNSHPYRFGLPGGAPPIGDFVEDPGPPLGPVRGRRQLRQNGRSDRPPGGHRLQGCGRQSEGRHCVCRGEPGRDGAAGAPAAGTVQGQSGFTGCARCRQLQGATG